GRRSATRSSGRCWCWRTPTTVRGPAQTYSRRCSGSRRSECCHNVRMSSVSLSGVSKTFPNGVVGLHPTDLDVPDGDRLALAGPAGPGKATLWRLTAGLDDAAGGEIRIGGEVVTRVPPHRRGVAFVPQRPALYPHLTVKENLEVPLRYPSGGR